MKLYSANKKSLHNKIISLQLFLEMRYGNKFEGYYSHINPKSTRPELDKTFRKLNTICDNIKNGVPNWETGSKND